MSLANYKKPYRQKKEISLIEQSLIQLGILLVLSLIGIFLMILILFLLIRNHPSSPYLFQLSENSTSSQISTYKILNDLYGLDKPIISQFFMFFWNMISGNWGNSLIIRCGWTIKEFIVKVYPKTIELNLVSFGVSLLLGVYLGYLAFKFKDKWFGRIPLTIKRLSLVIIILSMGLLLQYVFGYNLNLLPSKEYYNPMIVYNNPEMDTLPKITHFRLIDCLIQGEFTALWDTILHLIMPVFCLSIVMVSFITDLTYSIILLYKRQKDLCLLSGKIAFYLSIIFLSNLVLERIFNLSALGGLTLSSINTVDINMIWGTFYCIILTFLIINFSINFLVHIILIIKELKINHKLDKKYQVISSTSSKKSNPKLLSVTLKPVLETVLDEKTLLIEKKDNTNTGDKEIFEDIKSKIFNPLTIIGIIFISIIFILAIFAKQISHYDYELVQAIDRTILPSKPSIEHIYGVGKYGRDVFSRCIYGIQTAVKVGIFSTLIGMPLGVLIGIISAFCGKWSKFVIDIINGFVLMFPGILLVFLIIPISGSELDNFYWILGLVIFPFVILLTQQTITYELEKGKIEPLGFSKTNGRKIRLRLLNIILSILGVGSFIMGITILIFESIGFLGWSNFDIIQLGRDINIGRLEVTTAPWAIFWPAFWIQITTMSFIILGIGLKDK